MKESKKIEMVIDDLRHIKKKVDHLERLKEYKNRRLKDLTNVEIVRRLKMLHPDTSVRRAIVFFEELELLETLEILEVET